MLRLALMLCLAVFAQLAPTDGARAQNWTPVAGGDIDPREAGSRTFAVTPDSGPWRSIRISAPATAKIARAEVKLAQTDAVVKSGPHEITADKPAVLWIGNSPARIESVTIVWVKDASAKGTTKVTLEGLKAELGMAESTRSARTGATRGITRPDAAPAPAQPAPPVIASVPPPASPPAAPAPRRDEGGGREAAAPRPVAASTPPGPESACLNQSVCTIVNVFFGTDRKQNTTPTRIKFTADPDDKLRLGRGIVTVPKSRPRGELPRPGWIDWVRGLPPEGDIAKHLTIPRNGVKVYQSEADFLADVRKQVDGAGAFKDHAFIYIHGFGVTFDDALYRAAQISYDLSTDGNPFGTAFVYSWPSRGSILPTAYIADQDSADNAVPHLRAFIDLVTEKTGVKNVHIIAHSMGNRVLMRTIQEIVQTGGKAKINQVILAAPDVDKRQFETIAQNVGKVAKGATLYASTTDRAMTASRTAREGVPRAGDARLPPGPAIVAGIDTIDISALSSAVFALFDVGHDRYADSPELLADIRRIFVSGERPPEKRNNRFLLLKEGTLTYWRYK